MLAGLDVRQRLRALREANELTTAAATDPTIRAAVLLAAVQVARAEGHDVAARNFTRTMTPTVFDVVTKQTPWRERVTPTDDEEAAS